MNDDNCAEKFDHAGCNVRIEYDRDPQNPRKDFDHAATMVCEHRRYTLGDEDGADAAKEAVRKSRDYRASWEEGWEAKFDLSDPPQLWKAVQTCTDIVSMPLYLYDHSGITMSTGRFSCPWDSGQVGFIFITKDTILNEWGHKRLPPQQILTKKLKEQATACMEAEVEEYDQYLTGDIYGYVVTRGDDDDSESCWGFYGLQHAIEEAKSIAEYMEKQDANTETRPVAQSEATAPA